MLIRARLTHAIVVQPFRGGAAGTGPAGLKRREPRVAGAFDERRDGGEQCVFRQTAPFHHADSPRPHGELERRLPDTGEFGDDDAVLGEQRDDLRRVASDELDGAVRAGLLIHRGRELRAEKGDQLLEAFWHIHRRYFNSTGTAVMTSIYLNKVSHIRPLRPFQRGSATPSWQRMCTTSSHAPENDGRNCCRAADADGVCDAGLVRATGSARAVRASGRPERGNPTGRATVRPTTRRRSRAIWTRVRNPNPFGLTLNTLRATLMLEDTRAADGDFPLGLPLRSGEDSVVPLDLSISFSDVPALATMFRRSSASPCATGSRAASASKWHDRIAAFGPMTLFSGEMHAPTFSECEHLST